MSTRRRKLIDRHKRFLVHRLAAFDTPQEAADAFKDQFGVELTAQRVEHYDPNKSAGLSLAKHLKDEFEKARKAFLNKMESIPEAHRAVRVKQLAQASRAFKGHGNYVGMANMLERIAKEMGNAFTNRRELSGKGGGPIKFAEVDMMTEDEVDEELRRYGFDPDVHPAHTTEQ